MYIYNNKKDSTLKRVQTTQKNNAHHAIPLFLSKLKSFQKVWERGGGRGSNFLTPCSKKKDTRNKHPHPPNCLKKRHSPPTFETESELGM